MSDASGRRPKETWGTFPTRRLEALSDGVFAIAMTVIALELTALVGEVQDMRTMLREALAPLSAYVLSFLILSLFWLAHHLSLAYTERTDRLHVALMLLFLMLMAIIPFPAALIGTHPQAPEAFVIYAAVLTAAALILDVAWVYADRSASNSASTSGNADWAGRALRLRLRVAIAGYVACVCIAYLFPGWGIPAFFVAHVVLLFRPAHAPPSHEDEEQAAAEGAAR